MSDKLLDKHRFTFNPSSNGGESLCLTTKFYDNGDSEAGLPPNTCIYWDQELTLQSYCNAASFHLVGNSITPEALRKLADELEVKQAELEAQILEQQNKAIPSFSKAASKAVDGVHDSVLLRNTSRP